VIIAADARSPVISLSGPITPNTSCDPAELNGRIDIAVTKDPNDLTGAGVTYDILMAPDPNLDFPLSGQALGNYSATDLGTGDYSFTVNASNGCSATKSFTVIDNPTQPQLTAASISIWDAEYCDLALEQSARAVIDQINVIGGGA